MSRKYVPQFRTAVRPEPCPFRLRPEGRPEGHSITMGGRMAIQPNDGLGSAGTTYSDNGSSEVRERARELVSDARETGQELVSRAGERARSGIEDTKHRAARELDSVANALRGCGGDLGTQEDSMLA